MAHDFAPVQSYSCVTDLTAKQYYCMTMSGARTVAVCSAATDVVIGLLFSKPLLAGTASVPVAVSVAQLCGMTMDAAMDGTTDIAVLDRLGVNSSGVLVKKATGDYGVVAIALEVCTTNGVEIHPVLWLGFHGWFTIGG